MLCSKQNSRISSVSWLSKPSQIKTYGLSLANSLVWRSKTRLSHFKLILELLYLFSEYAKCQSEVSYAVQLLRWIEAGHIIKGSKDLSSVLIHSIAVIIVRLTSMSQWSFLSMRTFIESSMLNMTSVSFIL